MSTDLPETIDLHKAILGRIGDSDIAGHTYIDDQGRWIVQLGIVDQAGQRDLDVLEGDTFDFAGGKWRVSKVYEPSVSERGPVATLTKVT